MGEQNEAYKKDGRDVMNNRIMVCVPADEYKNSVHIPRWQYKRMVETYDNAISELADLKRTIKQMSEGGKSENEN